MKVVANKQLLMTHLVEIIRGPTLRRQIDLSCLVT